MILSIYAVESPPVVAVKAIREALRKLHDGHHASQPRPSLAEAKALLDTFIADGSVILGRTDADEGVPELIAALRANGVFVTQGSPERAARNHEAEKMRAAGATPEEQIAALAPGEPPEGAPAFRDDAAAACALALMQMAEGEPLTAAIYALTLCHAQGEGTIPVWRSVQQNLISTFPWIEQLLQLNGGLI